MPYLVWLSGLSAGLWIERSPVQFPLRAYAWAADQVPGWGRRVRGNRLMYLSHNGVPLLLCLPPFLSL